MKEIVNDFIFLGVKILVLINEKYLLYLLSLVKIASNIMKHN